MMGASDGFNEVKTDVTSPLFPTQEELLYKIVRRLWRDSEVNFSRNRNYEAYGDATVQRAMRIARRLKSVEADILRCLADQSSSAEATRHDDGTIHVHMDFGGGSTRHSILTTQEWGMLIEHDTIRVRFEHIDAHSVA